jgi:PelA/Pel-15E family pectate lyase
MRFRQKVALVALFVAATPPLSAKVVGQMVPAQPLTMQRIAALPMAQRPAWEAYLQRSQAQRKADKAALATEIAGLKSAVPPPPEGSTNSMPLDKPSEWYGSPDARRIADNIVSYQTPAGGWGKNQDRTAPPRQRGQSFVIIEHLPTEALPDIVTDDSRWAFVGTIDNGATTTEMRFLARVQGALPGQAGAAYRSAFLKGVRYLLDAQFPNGGWPQIYPLQGGYHDALTYNDDAVADVVDLLMDVGSRQSDYAFVPVPVADQALKAVDKAVSVILASQVVIHGKRTGWGQQHDPLTLAPVGARNFEPAALSSNESAKLLRLLMRLPKPTPTIVAAVHDGIAWLKSVALPDFEWAKATESQPRHLVAKPGAGPIWSRFYDLATMQPIFGDRDKTIHDNVDDLIPERRNGYSWYGPGPSSALKAYAKWAASYPRS